MRNFCVAHILLAISCFVFACQSKQQVPLDMRSFSYVNQNPVFPIHDLEGWESGVYTLTQNIENIQEGHTPNLNTVTVDHETNSIYFKSSIGWASYYFSFGSIGKLSSQVVNSCYSWVIDFSYLDSLGCLYQISNLKHDGSDTTIYSLDSLGRIVQVDGVEYGDLRKENFVKEVYYSGRNSIPDSIYTFYLNLRSKTRKEIFYHRHDTLDSMVVEVFKRIPYYARSRFVNYFDANGQFSKMRIIKDGSLFPLKMDGLGFVVNRQD
ncbi:hypothetical protein RCC89_15705 [Cytophagaceae bacterium ABcell3]|nr:hypothetical protein RCC89_15705 [Cytophagaceae bacterium ABcell3]